MINITTENTMHTIGLYQVVDTVAESTLGLIVKAYRDGLAVRMFLEALSAPKQDNEIAKYPADYVLYYIGQQDQETGAIVDLPTKPTIIYTGRQYVDQLRRDAAQATQVVDTPDDLGAVRPQPIGLQVVGDEERPKAV